MVVVVVVVVVVGVGVGEFKPCSENYISSLSTDFFSIRLENFTSAKI